MPPTKRRGNRFHNIGTDAALPQDRNETRQHHTYGHKLRPEAPHGAFDHRCLDVLMMQSSARF